jgi:tryptophan synthase alpha chain
MNRIDKLFSEKNQHILSVYFTAGHPALLSVQTIIKSLAESGVDMIEIGMPFSDPMADGPVIQHSSSIALKNGMTLKLLFEQLRDIRKETDIPLLMMGYLNPVLQYGIEAFCRDAASCGIDGIILPDLPLEVYNETYRQYFEKSKLCNVFLVSPQTRDERLYELDQAGKGFLYFVSSSSTTGVKAGFDAENLKYFDRISKISLRNPKMVGFGISNHDSFETVCRFVPGAIIGSAFVKMLSQSNDLPADIARFVKSIRKGDG